MHNCNIFPPRIFDPKWCESGLYKELLKFFRYPFLCFFYHNCSIRAWSTHAVLGYQLRNLFKDLFKVIFVEMGLVKLIINGYVTNDDLVPGLEYYAGTTIKGRCPNFPSWRQLKKLYLTHLNDVARFDPLSKGG